MLLNNLGIIEEIENINENSINYINLVKQLARADRFKCGNFFC
ncbi:hypothetical protein SACC_27980 [Saccharolobus caldissimus]|uniref:Uncharacterized protein n=1 Tax=Saccharolobus caldissimus TaxID=1702097 RepID=A0AAQ4CVF0_9CREN|nr:hypothetical protein SACC_27980 [Saccharolobus caldissimus]